MDMNKKERVSKWARNWRHHPCDNKRSLSKKGLRADPKRGLTNDHLKIKNKRGQPDDAVLF